MRLFVLVLVLVLVRPNVLVGHDDMLGLAAGWKPVRLIIRSPKHLLHLLLLDPLEGALFADHIGPRNEAA